MKVIDIRTRQVKASTSKNGKAASPKSVRIILTEVEREVILEACKKYRHTIPVYIKSKKPLVDVLDDIIGRLS